MSHNKVVNPAAAFAFAPAEATAAENNALINELKVIGQRAHDYAETQGFDAATRAAYQHAVAVDAIGQVRGQIKDAQTLRDMYQTVMGYEDQESTGFWQGLKDVGNSLAAGFETGVAQVQSFFDPTWGGDNRAAAAEHRAALSDAAKADRVRADSAYAFRESIGDNPWQITENLKERPLDATAELLGNIAPSTAGVIAGTAASATGAGASVGVPLMAASLGAGALQSGGAVRDDIYTTTMQLTDQELSQYSPMYQGLIKSGMSPEEAKRTVATSLSDNWGEFLGATALGAAASFIPAGGAGRNIVTKALGQLAYSPERGVINNALREGLVEAGTEAWQQRLSNSAVKDTVDTRRDLNQGVAESAVLGGVIGSAISAGAGSALHAAHGGNGNTETVTQNESPIEQALNPTEQAVTEPATNDLGYNRADLIRAASKLPESLRQRYIEDFETDAKFGILDTQTDTPYSRFVRDVLGMENTVTPTADDAVAQVGETVPSNLKSPIEARIGDDDIVAANQDTLYEPGDQAAVEQGDANLQKPDGKRVTKTVARKKATNDKYYDINDQEAAADSTPPRSSSLDRARVKHIRGSKKFEAINDADYDSVNNVVLEPETATQPVEEIATAKTEEVKPKEAIKVTYVNREKVEGLANTNLNKYSPAELEAIARKELNGNEYRLLVSMLKERTAEDYDADGNFIGKQSELEGNNAKRERKPEKKATWVAKQLERMMVKPEPEPTPAPTVEPEPAPTVEPAPAPTVEPESTQPVSKQLTELGAKHSELESNMDFDSDYWKVRDHGFNVNENFAENLTENIDEVTEAGLPDIFAGDNEVAFNAPGKAEAFKKAVARHFPADDELVVMATTAPIGSKKFSSEPMVVNADGKLATTNNAPEFTTDVQSAQRLASQIDGRVYGAYIRADNVYPWLGNNLPRAKRLALAKWAGEQGYDGVALEDNGNISYVPSKTGTTMGTNLSVSKAGRVQKDVFYSRGEVKSINQDRALEQGFLTANKIKDLVEAGLNHRAKHGMSEFEKDFRTAAEEERGHIEYLQDEGEEYDYDHTEENTEYNDLFRREFNEVIDKFSETTSNGLLVLNHGTGNKFDEFKIGRNNRDAGYHGEGVYLSPVREMSEYYAGQHGHVMKLVVNPKKVYVMPASWFSDNPSPEITREFSDGLRSEGYDMIIAHANEYQGLDAERADANNAPNFEFVVLDPKIIRSVDAEFSGADTANIYASRQNKRDVSSVEMEAAKKIADDIGAENVRVVTSDQVPAEAADAHGYYDAATGGVTIIADNISSPAQVKWVLWHELSHRILRAGRLAIERSSIIRQARQNKFINELAMRIQRQRSGTDDFATENFDVAVEEAIVELSAAVKHEKGINAGLDILGNKYDMDIPSSMRSGIRGTVNRLYQRFKALVSRVYNSKMSDADIYQLVTTKLSRNNLLSNELGVSKTGWKSSIDNAISNIDNQPIPESFSPARREQMRARHLLDAVSSVFVNGDGDLTLYRGDAAGISKFGQAESTHKDYGWYGKGTYTTVEPELAKGYANSKQWRSKIPHAVYEIKASLSNPYIYTGGKLSEAAAAELTKVAQDSGYDSIVAINSNGLAKINAQLNRGMPVEIKPGDVEIIALDTHKVTSSGLTGAVRDESQGLFYSQGSNNQDVLDFARTGKSVVPDGGIFGTGAKTWGEMMTKFGRAIERRISDDLVPMKEYIENLGLDKNTEQTLIGDLYLSDGARANKSSEFEHKYMAPLFKKIHDIAKANNMEYIDAKRAVGFWMSARYALIKNQDFIHQDRDAYQAASNEYNQNPTQSNYDKMMKARRQLAKRQADVFNPDPAAKGFEVGVAGGYNNAKAQAVMQGLENLVPKADIEEAAQHIYDMQAARLDLDLASGRIGQQAYNEYKANPYYVPLTGDPRADADVDDVISTGGQSVNQRGQKQAKGRKDSMAEDGIDATWRSVARSIGYFGYSKFKNGIRDIYKSRYNALLAQGKTEAEAAAELESTMGIERSKVTMQRTSDAVLMISENGDNYAYKLPKKAMDALMHNQRESVPWILKAVETPTRLFARAVTQFYPAFAPINFARDAWERSTVLRTRTVYDANGNKVDMDAVANRMLVKMSDPMAFRDTVFWRTPDGKTQRSQNLKDLMEAGGISTMGSFLSRTEKDLIKRIQREGRWDKQTIDGVVHFTEAYNRAFDLVPPLAAYESLLEAGVSKRDAAAVTLDTMNFRKTGLYMRPVKALFMFAQPTATGFVNLAKQLGTKKGAIIAATYYATMLGMYEVIRAVSGQDDNEAGNRVDQMGDITRYIPIPNPMDPGKYFKIPVGFGLPQLMWNMAVNTSRAAHGDIEWSSAAANMAAHWSKVVVPVAPADIPVDENPGAKIAMTATPSIIQPIMQLILDRTPFGAKLTPQYVDKGKLRAEQAKSTTAPEWKEFAIAIQRVTGVDMHAEQVKALWDGYSGMLGPLRDITKIAIENPNRARLGKEEYVPFVNSLYGPGNEYAIQQRYYEAFDKAQKLKNEYDSRKERGQLGGWLTPEKRKQINWFERADRELRVINQQKAKVTKRHAKGMPDDAYQKQVNNFAKRTEQVQAKYLHEWRKMEGLNTKRGK